MTRRQLRIAWNAIGLFLLLFSIRTISSGQSGEDLFDVLILDRRNVPNVYMAISVLGFLIFTQMVVGIVHALRSRATSRLGRIPVLAYERLSFNDPLARLYHGFSSILVVLIPLHALLYCWDTLVDDGALIYKHKDIGYSFRVLKGKGDFRADVKVTLDQSAATGAENRLRTQRLKKLDDWINSVGLPSGYCIGVMRVHDSTEHVEDFRKTVLVPVARERAERMEIGETGRGTEDICSERRKFGWEGGATWVAGSFPTSLIVLMLLPTVFAFGAFGLFCLHVFAPAKPNSGQV